MKNLFAGIVVATFAVSAQAAIVTERYAFTLPTAQSGYSAGHVFQITATYDNAGTVMHAWDDGLNEMAQNGGGDDTVIQNATLTQYPDYSLFSDATITVSGIRPLDPGLTPYDWLSSNMSRVDRQRLGINPTNTLLAFQWYADDLAVTFALNGPMDPDTAVFESAFLEVRQWYTNPQGVIGLSRMASSAVGAGSLVRVESVPEPTTLALLALGLSGIGLAWGRNRQKSRD